MLDEHGGLPTSNASCPLRALDPRNPTCRAACTRRLKLCRRNGMGAITLRQGPRMLVQETRLEAADGCHLERGIAAGEQAEQRAVRSGPVAWRQLRHPPETYPRYVNPHALGMEQTLGRLLQHLKAEWCSRQHVHDKVISFRGLQSSQPWHLCRYATRDRAQAPADEVRHSPPHRLRRVRCVCQLLQKS